MRARLALTLVNVGKHSDKIHLYLTEKQGLRELERPARFHLESYAYIDRYTSPVPLK
jgi:hypothetical protein